MVQKKNVEDFKQLERIERNHLVDFNFYYLK